ncbi:aminopeptidase P family protein [Halobacteria archaeon AArc-curdl1]|uniref:Aminopeptidase P family protein n=1 Tax=Natronosalvus hydrolyticus TaxID=2979988 RepID=A0AAP2ZB40_9EURY|nr:aminopeptidase P family protein [Halobacteria archaeon AArc-curdl1]
MEHPFTNRIAACQKRLETADAAVVILSPGPNLTYLAGIEESPSERHFLYIVPADGTPQMVAPTMYEAELEEAPIGDFRCWGDGDDPVAILDTVLAEYGVTDVTDDSTILLDDRMWTVFAQDVRRIRPDATYGLASSVVGPLRITKDSVERDALRKAGELADRVSMRLRERGDEIIGMTEAKLADEIDRLLTVEDGLEPSFDSIVAAGPNGARPHHHPGAKRIEAGDPVVLDFGAFVPADLEAGSARYPGDQTRTIVFDGEPPGEYETVHETVRAAQEAAVEHAEPGVTAASVDRIARDIIEEAGYGDAFVHRTGHGVGLEVHEPPYIVEGNETTLEPGMVFSVEPGIYLEGEFGVRLEDLVLVTDDGVERLNESPMRWRA